jgi:sec-independent protein translocase protein TatA
MIGPLEIAIIVAILLVVFGAKFLPALGRNAGKAVRIGREKGSEVATKVTNKAEGYDPKQIARTAGEHVREARELRDEFTGKGPAPAESAPEPERESQPAPEPTPPPENENDKEST